MVIRMIQWFPGHMAKAKREIKESLSLVDLVIELVDARIPASSQNPLLQEAISGKEKIIVLMKKDLADPEQTKAWIKHFEEQSLTALAVDANNRRDVAKLVDVVYEKGIVNQKEQLEKGV